MMALPLPQYTNLDALTGLPPACQLELLTMFYRNLSDYRGRSPDTVLRVLLCDVRGAPPGAGFISFTIRDLVSLGPPDPSLGHLIDWSAPCLWPKWLYYSSGKLVRVDTPEELAQQPPGSGPTPEGPWPAGFEGPWPWDDGKGPFRLFTEYRHARPFGVHAVYSETPITCDGQAWSPYAVFSILGSIEGLQLLEKGRIKRVPDDYSTPQNPVLWPCEQHKETFLWFLHKEACDAYDRLYKDGDVRTFMADTTVEGHPQATATSEPEAAPRSQLGRPPDAEWRSWSFEKLLELLKAGWRRAREKYPHKTHPSFDDVAECTGYSRKSLYEALKKYQQRWGTIRPFLDD